MRVSLTSLVVNGRMLRTVSICLMLSLLFACSTKQTSESDSSSPSSMLDSSPTQPNSQPSTTASQPLPLVREEEQVSKPSDPSETLKSVPSTTTVSTPLVQESVTTTTPSVLLRLTIWMLICLSTVVGLMILSRKV